MLKHAFCCDWGTSALRIRLVNAETEHIIDQETSNQGIASTFELWQRQVESGLTRDRTGFYLSQLEEPISKLINRGQLQEESIPLVLSGMASSSIGMVELPYVPLPFHLDGSNAFVHCLENTAPLNRPVMIISGLKDGQEVMRGEETQLVGIAPHLAKLNITGNTTIILPGTHSKHVLVHDGTIRSIQTFVTGELFNLVNKNGLLKEAVQTTGAIPGKNDWEAFRTGVSESGETSLLQGLFKTRTNQLFKRLNKQENYYYLSGLLIGYELRTVQANKTEHILLCSDPALHEYYWQALHDLEFKNTFFIDAHKVDQATVSGQLKIAGPWVSAVANPFPDVKPKQLK